MAGLDPAYDTRDNPRRIKLKAINGELMVWYKYEMKQDNEGLS